ncbi:MAG: acylneuraminate cytidylyltransferase family protein [Acidobacteriota bacterium]|nr:acylneuraminate cytidylyltransferase family protein [Acidobacteriota bacterium]
MISGLSVLGLIPARGGSKGVPRKNILPVGGRPLIAWTVDAARASRYIDRIVVSSDNDEIIQVARELGCDVPFKRPSDLALDETPSIDPVLHALTQLPGYDLVALLQPTSPMRTGDDIDGCLERLIATGAPACITMREAIDHPFWTFRCDPRGRMQPFMTIAGGTPTRRQDLPHAFVANGAVYVAQVNWLMDSRDFETKATVGFEMPRERSLDIDTQSDLKAAEIALMRRRVGA